MLRFKWNALRIGDTVVVHDPWGYRDPAASGTVVMVDTKRGKHSANGVGIRVAAEGGHRVVWPSFLTVHDDLPISDRRLLALRGRRRGYGGTPRANPRAPRGSCPVSTWEYLIVALPAFKEATPIQGQSDSVAVLNAEGSEGWEAVGMTALGNGHVAVLLKRGAATEPHAQRP